MSQVLPLPSGRPLEDDPTRNAQCDGHTTDDCESQQYRLLERSNHLKIELAATRLAFVRTSAEQPVIARKRFDTGKHGEGALPVVDPRQDRASCVALGRQFLLNDFMTFGLPYDIYLRSPLVVAGSLGRERGRWPLGPQLLKEWGRRGLSVADANMDRIVELCREWRCQLTVPGDAHFTATGHRLLFEELPRSAEQL